MVIVLLLCVMDVQIGMTTWNNTPTYRGFDTHVGYFGCDEDCLYRSLNLISEILFEFI